jgi:protein-disulfide isomerase
MNKQVIALVVIAIVVIGGGILLFINGNGVAPAEVGKSVDNTKLIREHSRMTKKADAKVTIVEFADFQCPACAATNQTVKELIESYKDNPNVNFVFRHFPLDIHKNAKIGAEAAEAAGQQGRFWEMSDLLYTKQAEWSNSANPIDQFATYAMTLGLDLGKFKTSIQSNQFANIIAADVTDGNDLGVNATPTFYINGEKQATIPSLQDFRSIIEEKLK